MADVKTLKTIGDTRTLTRVSAVSDKRNESAIFIMVFIFIFVLFGPAPRFSTLHER